MVEDLNGGARDADVRIAVVSSERLSFDFPFLFDQVMSACMRTIESGISVDYFVPDGRLGRLASIDHRVVPIPQSFPVGRRLNSIEDWAEYGSCVARVLIGSWRGYKVLYSTDEISAYAASLALRGRAAVHLHGPVIEAQETHLREFGDIGAARADFLVANGSGLVLRSAGQLSAAEDRSYSDSYAKRSIDVGAFVDLCDAELAVTLIKAAKILSRSRQNFVLRILGDGPRANFIERYIRAEGVRSNVRILKCDDTGNVDRVRSLCSMSSIIVVDGSLDYRALVRQARDMGRRVLVSDLLNAAASAAAGSGPVRGMEKLRATSLASQIESLLDDQSAGSWETARDSELWAKFTSGLTEQLTTLSSSSHRAVHETKKVESVRTRSPRESVEELEQSVRRRSDKVEIDLVSRSEQVGVGREVSIRRAYIPERDTSVSCESAGFWAVVESGDGVARPFGRGGTQEGTPPRRFIPELFTH